MTSTFAKEASVDQRFVLHDVAWGGYESLLQAVGDQHVFVTFDQGTLELISPSMEHDWYAEHVGVMIRVLAAEDDTTWVRLFRQWVQAHVLPKRSI